MVGAVPFIASPKRQAGKLFIPIFIVPGLTRTRIELPFALISDRVLRIKIVYCFVSLLTGQLIIVEVVVQRDFYSGVGVEKNHSDSDGPAVDFVPEQK